MVSLHQRNKSFNCPLTESESRIKSLAIERWGTILSPALIWHFDLCILLYHSNRPYAGLHKWGDVVGDMGYGAPPQYIDDLSSYGISTKDKTVYIINNWLICYHSNYQRQIIMGYVTWGRHFARNGLTTCKSIEYTDMLQSHSSIQNKRFSWIVYQVAWRRDLGLSLCWGGAAHWTILRYACKDHCIKPSW